MQTESRNFYPSMGDVKKKAAARAAVLYMPIILILFKDNYPFLDFLNMT